MVGAPACGDVMKLQIKVNPATGLIEDARFKTYGCGSAIASSSLVTEWVKGKTLDQAMTIKNTADRRRTGACRRSRSTARSSPRTRSRLRWQDYKATATAAVLEPPACTHKATH